jgi:hypothetical protein
MNNNLFFKIRQSKKDAIEKKIESLKSIVIPEDELMMTSLNQILKMREMYDVDINVDDILLFEKYDMLTNIDIAHQLSDNLFIKVANGNNSKNILNEFLPKSETFKTIKFST